MSDAGIDRAEEAVGRARRAASRVDGLRRQLDAERAEVARLRARLEDESADVAELERHSVRAVLAKLRKRHGELLDAERAEMAAAAIELATRREVVEPLTADLADSVRAAGSLADAEQTLRRAIDERTSGIVASREVSAVRLATIIETVPSLRTAIVEIDEAITAARYARVRIESAIASMSSARVVVDPRHVFRRRHDRQRDQVRPRRRRRRGRGRRAVRTPPTPSRARRGRRSHRRVVARRPSAALRGMDIWFDNIFSDLMARERLNASLDDLRETAQRVGKVEAETGRRRDSTTYQLDELAAEQRSLVFL